VIPFALGETWFAVFGGLIPIIGLAGIVFILYRAIGPNDNESPSPHRANPPSTSQQPDEEDRDR